VIVGTSDIGSELPTQLKLAGREPPIGRYRKLLTGVETSDRETSNPAKTGWPRTPYRKLLWSEVPTHTEIVIKLGAQVCDSVSLLDG
jgi:hypothetical protein